MANPHKTILVTGGAGFIGSALCRHLVRDLACKVINLDKLTYAASLSSLAAIEESPLYRFVKLDICDRQEVRALLAAEKVDAIMHLAAETHVDRSIDGPAAFLETNVMGTLSLLEAARDYTSTLAPAARDAFRFHHVSTDEVYGDLPFDDSLFTEDTAYDPSSPYSASKAASDHLARAWHRTYKLPVVVSNCSNNYGPYQFPEKLIPLSILNALEGRPLTVYGTGENVRDWLHVEDHARALATVMLKGKPGRTYNIGGDSERTNLQVVKQICAIMDRLHPRPHDAHASLIELVRDRPGHDRRYAIDSSRIRDELGWRPQHNFEDGLEATVRWYLGNEDWWRPLRERRYAGARLGLVE